MVYKEEQSISEQCAPCFSTEFCRWQNTGTSYKVTRLINTSVLSLLRSLSEGLFHSKPDWSTQWWALPSESTGCQLHLLASTGVAITPTTPTYLIQNTSVTHAQVQNVTSNRLWTSVPHMLFICRNVRLGQTKCPLKTRTDDHKAAIHNNNMDHTTVEQIVVLQHLFDAGLLKKSLPPREREML